MGPVLFASRGWSAVQMWATALGHVESDSGIANFSQTTDRLGTLIQRIDRSSPIGHRLAQASPQEASDLLLSLEGTATSRELNVLVIDSFADSLRRQAAVMSARVYSRDLENPPLPIEEPGQIIAYGAALVVSTPKILTELHSMHQAAEQLKGRGDHLESLRPRLESAETNLKDLRLYLASLRASTLHRIDFNPRDYEPSLQVMADSIAFLQQAIDSGFDPHSSSLIRDGLLQARESLAGDEDGHDWSDYDPLGEPMTNDSEFDRRTLVALSKVTSLALRHSPELFELEMDGEGWVPIEQYLASLQLRPRWAQVDRNLLAAMVEAAEGRFEIEGEKIRALYGHSVPGRLAKQPAIPPQVLYHGTDRRFLPMIMRKGLEPMKRQYVHLSTTREKAFEVGQRKGDDTVILIIRTEALLEQGIHFYKGNDLVWLVDTIPSDGIEFPEQD